MFPTLDLPLSALGALLLAAAAAWWWYWSRQPAPGRDRRGFAALGVLGGLVLAGAGGGRALTLPVYGLMMVAGTVTGLVLGMRWAGQRGLSQELIVEMALIGIFGGLFGARAVYLVETWDTMFADLPPGLPCEGPSARAPLAAGDELRLRSHQGEATIRFDGTERDPAALARAIEGQGAAADLAAKVFEAKHRGDDGLAIAQRGLLLRTGKRGPDAWVEVRPSSAAAKLGLQPGVRALGAARPLWRVVDLRLGGLTYFGAVFGTLIPWFAWLRWRRLRALDVLDAVAPVLPLGLFFGRVGCLARGCCYGREAGEGAVFGVHYPPWSLPWLQMATERLSVVWDSALGKREMTPALRDALGPLADHTPALQPSQLYEGLGVLVIFAIVVLYRVRWQTRIGQCFLLVVLLQTPLRFAVEHTRRDQEVFFPVAGYPLTESQVVALVFFVLAVPAFAWLSRHGRPVATARVTEGIAPEPAAAAAPRA